ncbi:hypothetical protein N9954_00445 [Maribacter sp.]|nr:hypothetical protein [Maribacter sp.]
MSGGGHTLDMVNRIKQNKTRKRKKFKGDNWKLALTGKINEITEYSFPTVSESELELIKMKIRVHAKQNMRDSIYALAISIAIVGLLAFLFLKFYP